MYSQFSLGRGGSAGVLFLDSTFLAASSVAAISVVIHDIALVLNTAILELHAFPCRGNRF